MVGKEWDTYDIRSEKGDIVLFMWKSRMSPFVPRGEDGRPDDLTLLHSAGIVEACQDMPCATFSLEIEPHLAFDRKAARSVTSDVTSAVVANLKATSSIRSILTEG